MAPSSAPVSASATSSPAPKPPFRPALIIVDFQNDFCPPTGSLAVPDGRAIATPINDLLQRSCFVAKIATQDWHPPNHISFATNHNDKKPFVDSIDITNPLNSREKQTTRLWPVHCVQNTEGAQLVRELDATLVTHVVQKGTDPRIEMYSAFRDPFRAPSVVEQQDGTSKMATILRERQVTHCYVVGLAYDYCVKCTAVDAAEEGFVTYVVREATRAVDESSAGSVEKDLGNAGVKLVHMDGEEVQKLYS